MRSGQAVAGVAPRGTGIALLLCIQFLMAWKIVAVVGTASGNAMTTTMATR
jgi:hypothetical protein